MADPRRERYLVEEIDRLQDQKIKALADSKTVRGLEKCAVLDLYADLDRKQKVLEIEFERLQEEE